MDLYWVGVDQDWHTATNWSQISGGPGDGRVPTSVDNVFIDGNGFALCWATTSFECNNFTILVGSTEMCLFDQGGIIYGDFEMQDGYFGPTGGGGYTVEFKGNWLKTGGTFAVGTGTGVDPTCEFSGTGKTYALNDAGSASYQNVLVSGTLTISGTRLGQMNIAQKLSVTGTMTINEYDVTTICNVELSGNNAGFDTFSGTIEGTGRLWYVYKDNSTMPTTGTLKVRYCRYRMDDSTASLPARTYNSPCEVEVEYTADGQTFTLESNARHYFYKLTIKCDEAAVNTAEFDCDTNTAEMWVTGKFDIYKDAFPSATFTIKFGDGIHVFRGSIDFYFSYASGAATQLVVDAGEGTLILWPKGRELVPV